MGRESCNGGARARDAARARKSGGKGGFEADPTGRGVSCRYRPSRIATRWVGGGPETAPHWSRLRPRPAPYLTYSLPAARSQLCGGVPPVAAGLALATGAPAPLLVLAAFAADAGAAAVAPGTAAPVGTGVMTTPVTLPVMDFF